jgi:hypothetical protein
MQELSNITVDSQKSVERVFHKSDCDHSGNTRVPSTAQNKSYLFSMRLLAKALLSHYIHRVITRNTLCCANFCRARLKGCCRLQGIQRGAWQIVSAVYTQPATCPTSNFRGEGGRE